MSCAEFDHVVKNCVHQEIYCVLCIGDVDILNPCSCLYPCICPQRTYIVDISIIRCHGTGRGIFLWLGNLNKTGKYTIVFEILMVLEDLGHIEHYYIVQVNAFFLPFSAFFFFMHFSQLRKCLYIVDVTEDFLIYTICPPKGFIWGFLSLSSSGAPSFSTMDFVGCYLIEQQQII